MGRHGCCAYRHLCDGHRDRVDLNRQGDISDRNHRLGNRTQGRRLIRRWGTDGNRSKKRSLAEESPIITSDAPAAIGTWGSGLAAERPFSVIATTLHPVNSRTFACTSVLVAMYGGTGTENISSPSARTRLSLSPRVLRIAVAPSKACRENRVGSSPIQ